MNPFERVREVVISRGATINLGNYESARIDVQMVMDVKPGEDGASVFEILDRVVKSALAAKIDALENPPRESRASRFFKKGK